MPVNKYFDNFKSESEKAQLADLLAEAIEIHGINALYIHRDNPDVDLFLGEDPLAKFQNWCEMAMYVKDGQGFTGKTLQAQWGISMPQLIVLQCAKSEFIRQVDSRRVPNRPLEGDLINLPYGLPGQYLLEIKFVSDSDVPFIQLGGEYIYDISCRIFTGSHESFKTGLDEIDVYGAEVKQSIEIETTVGTGTFLMGEIAYQGASFATSTFKAVVKNVDGVKLSLTNMNGEINQGLPLKGNTSLASRTILGDQKSIDNDPIAQNELIQTIADPIFVKNSRNPFDKGRQ